MSANPIVQELLPRTVTGPDKKPITEDRRALERAVVLYVGERIGSDKAGAYEGFTRGPVLIDHIRQQHGRMAYDACKWLVFERGLMEQPPASVDSQTGSTKPSRVDAWRLTGLGIEVYELLRAAMERELARAATEQDTADAATLSRVEGASEHKKPKKANKKAKA